MKYDQLIPKGRKSVVLAGAALVACVASQYTACAQINSQLSVLGTSLPVPLAGPNGQLCTLTSQLGFGVFAGFGNQFLYAYTIRNTGVVPIDGFNIWTGSLVNAINAPAAGGVPLAVGTDLVVSDAGDTRPLPAGNSPAGAIPTTPGGTFVGNSATTAAGAINPGVTFVTIASSDLLAGRPAGGWFTSTFPTLGNYTINMNSTWGFTVWSTGAGANQGTLVRWFSPAAGTDLAAGASMTFDVFSSFGPVPGGAFPDPAGGGVDFSIDDENFTTNSTDGTFMAADPDVTVPEPGILSLAAVSILGVGLWRRKMAA